MLEVAPADVGMSAERLENLKQYVTDKYITSEKLPCAQVAVLRDGKVCYHATMGSHGLDSAPLADDAIYRMYSMTKPITSVVAMHLVERGLMALDDPIHRYLPEFSRARVWRAGAFPEFLTDRTTSPVRVWHLLTHTSGLTYGFQRSTNVDAAYRNTKVDLPPLGTTLAEWTEQLAKLPLIQQPGEGFNYSVSTDVLGRIIEVICQKSLGEVFEELVFGPLGMKDTAFRVPESKRSRFLPVYDFAVGARPKRLENEHRYAPDNTFESGGGGLVGTMADYIRFVQLLANGGALDGYRLISPATLEYMTLNHLPNGADLFSSATASFSEVTYAGVGFGLGFSTVVDPVAAKVVTSPGEYGWGGLASTNFSIDPYRRVSTIFLTQLIPSSTYPLRREIRSIVNAAIEQ